jgi:uncharacterized protein (UPF0335 family)
LFAPVSALRFATLCYTFRMGREMLEQHLAQAERHVAEGEDHIARQRQIVDELASSGHDLKAAQELLALFEDMQKSHIADRDRLRAELAAIG